MANTESKAARLEITASGIHEGDCISALNALRRHLADHEAKTRATSERPVTLTGGKTQGLDSPRWSVTCRWVYGDTKEDSPG